MITGVFLYLPQGGEFPPAVVVTANRRWLVRLDQDSGKPTLAVLGDRLPRQLDGQKHEIAGDSHLFDVRRQRDWRREQSVETLLELAHRVRRREPVVPLRLHGVHPLLWLVAQNRQLFIILQN